MEVSIAMQVFTYMPMIYKSNNSSFTMQYIPENSAQCP
jgi:hypothetical protein